MVLFILSSILEVVRVLTEDLFGAFERTQGGDCNRRSANIRYQAEMGS